MERDDYFFVDGELGTDDAERSSIVETTADPEFVEEPARVPTVVDEPPVVLISNPYIQAEDAWILICKTSTEGLHGEHGVVDLMQNSVTKEVRAFPVK